MNKRIFKYVLKVEDIQTIETHAGAEFLSVQDQDGQLCLWVIVDLDATVTVYTIHIRGTGHFVPDDVQYIGTAQQSPFVWHVFWS